MEDQALHIVGEVDEHDLGLGALEADGANEQAHVCLLLRKNMLDLCTDFGFDPVCRAQCVRAGFAFGLLAVDAADPALGFKPHFILLRPIGRVGPERASTPCRGHGERSSGGGVFGRHHFVEL